VAKDVCRRGVKGFESQVVCCHEAIISIIQSGYFEKTSR
jgi:hypothetical protein